MNHWPCRRGKDSGPLSGKRFTPRQRQGSPDAHASHLRSHTLCWFRQLPCQRLQTQHICGASSNPCTLCVARLKGLSWIWLVLEAPASRATPALTDKLWSVFLQCKHSIPWSLSWGFTRKCQCRLVLRPSLSCAHTPGPGLGPLGTPSALQFTDTEG